MLTPQPLKLHAMTIEELQQRLAETNAAIAERREEELKVLADGFARKLAANGFSIREGIDALKPYAKLKGFGGSGR
jgi:DNA-binding protein H-NS